MKQLLFIVLGMYFSLSTLQSQTCPPNDTCTNWTSYVDTISLSFFSDISGVVYYRVQVCNGVTRFIIDSSFAIDNGNHLDTFSIYHFNFDTFKDLLNISLMNKIADDSISVPNCGTDTVKTVQFYTAACGVWVKCSYKVDTNSVVCDHGWNAPKPHYFNSGDWWVDYWRWHSCGKTCCEKTYKICRTTAAPPFSGTITKITQVTKRATEPCTLQNQFRDWRTGALVPCGNDC